MIHQRIIYVRFKESLKIMLTFIQALLKAYLTKPLIKSQFKILEKLRIHYETSPRMSENNFGIVMNFKDLILYARLRKDYCPWIYDVSLDIDEIDIPLFWIKDDWTVKDFEINSICCSKNIVIELNNSRLYDFFRLAQDIAKFLKVDIPPDGSSENNIGESSFVFNICFPEKICECS